PKRKKWPALVDLVGIRKFIAVVDVSPSYPVTRLASRFLALVAQRPGMVHRMQWSHLESIDWSADSTASPDALWHIPSEEMKLEFEKRGEDEWDHDVPLSPQAVDLLKEVRKLTGGCPFVFPNCWNPQAPMTENALNSLYRRLG